MYSLYNHGLVFYVLNIILTVRCQAFKPRHTYYYHVTTAQFLSGLICLEIVDTNVFWLLFKIIKSCTYSLNILQGFLSCLRFVLDDNQVNEMCRCCAIENIAVPPCSVGWRKVRCIYEGSSVCVCGFFVRPVKYLSGLSGALH